LVCESRTPAIKQQIVKQDDDEVCIFGIGATGAYIGVQLAQSGINVSLFA